MKFKIEVDIKSYYGDADAVSIQQTAEALHGAVKHADLDVRGHEYLPVGEVESVAVYHKPTPLIES